MQRPERYYLIDGMRTLMALIVVLYHYHDLFLNKAAQKAGLGMESTRDMGFFQPIGWITEHGPLAVMMFWSISGFVFAHVYSQRQNTDGWAFFVQRFSRLYPLHFVTLIYIAGLQLVALSAFGTGVITGGQNDLPRFIAQLFFVSGWGFGNIYSFNSPVWSVSVEIASYAAFWAILRIWGIGYASAVAAFMICIAGMLFTRSLIPVCGAYFFLAVVAWCALQTLETLSSTWRWVLTSGGVAVSFLPLVVSLIGFDLPLTVILAPICSAAIIVLALVEHRAKADLSVLESIGNITYSTYLIHMPLQMTFGMLMLAGLVSPLILLNSFVPAIYLLIVIVGGHFCFRHFELPAQQWLRRAMSKPAMQRGIGART